MARLFMSYARQDADQAQHLAEALGASGHDVWWDHKIHGGSRFGEEIDRALSESDVAIVLWSSSSVASTWVLDEAAEARDTGKLIPVLIAQCKPPLGYRQYQSIDLTDWSVGEAVPERLLHAIMQIAGVPQSTASVPRGASRAPGMSVCVLPFVNMSGEAEQEYFSDGISEDITTDLSKVSALAVTARNSAFTFKGKAVDVCDIARKLGVSHVLEGSVRKAGSRVRITAQLIDGTTGDHIWADRYDRDLTDIFAIQDEISHSIVDALKLKLLPDEKKAIEQRGTTNADAYNLYLMARQYWITGNHGDRRREERVVRICKRAIEIDRDYARAWALMAIAQCNLRYGFSVGEDREDNGLDAAQRALDLDPSIAEAHCPIARELAQQGRFEEADAEIALALSLDPDSWEVNKEAARIYLRQRRMADAAHYLERAVELMETDFHAWGILVSCYFAIGNKEGLVHAAAMGMKQIERVLREDPNNGAAYSFGAGNLAILGQPDRAREMMQRGLLVDPDNLNMRHNFACDLAAHLHDKEGALEMMEPIMKVCSERIVDLSESDPDLDSIRDDPRFRQMISDARARLALEQPIHQRQN